MTRDSFGAYAAFCLVVNLLTLVPVHSGVRKAEGQGESPGARSFQATRARYLIPEDSKIARPFVFILAAVALKGGMQAK